MGGKESAKIGETLDIIKDDGVQANEFITRDAFIEAFMTLYFGPNDEQNNLLFNMYFRIALFIIL